MTHLSDDDLVLHYYGEANDLRTAGMHLQACEDCRRRFEELSRALEAMNAIEVPERDEQYGAQVWAAIQPRLDAAPIENQTRTGFWAFLGRNQSGTGFHAAFITLPRLAMAGSVAVLLVAAFAAGSYWQVRNQSGTDYRQTAVAAKPHADAAVPGARERILLVAVGDHLDRSEMVLAEISNLGGTGEVDISSQQDWARDLVASNRLYRQAAVRDGKAGVADVLDELERVLVDIANGPSTVSSADLDRLRERIASQGLVFKVKVIGSQVRRDASRPIKAAARSKS
jgi:hypothetical protein